MFFFFQAEDGIRDVAVTGVQTCALPISIADLGAALQIGNRALAFAPRQARVAEQGSGHRGVLGLAPRWRARSPSRRRGTSRCPDLNRPERRKRRGAGRVSLPPRGARAPPPPPGGPPPHPP